MAKRAFGDPDGRGARRQLNGSIGSDLDAAKRDVYNLRAAVAKRTAALIDERRIAGVELLLDNDHHPARPAHRGHFSR